VIAILPMAGPIYCLPMMQIKKIAIGCRDGLAHPPRPPLFKPMAPLANGLDEKPVKSR
jgi:hypothetical protein